MGTDREGDIMQLTNTTDYAIRIVCYLASENKVITTAEKKLLKRQRDRMEAICWKNDRKKFLLWTLLTVQSQQWQLADVWRRTDTVPEIIQIAARYIRCYWICRTLIITGWKM